LKAEGPLGTRTRLSLEDGYEDAAYEFTGVAARGDHLVVAGDRGDILVSRLGMTPPSGSGSPVPAPVFGNENRQYDLIGLGRLRPP
jgi:hypothetical protein